MVRLISFLFIVMLFAVTSYAADLKGLTLLVADDAVLEGENTGTVAPLAFDLPKYLRKELKARGAKVVVSHDAPYDFEAKLSVELGFTYAVFSAWVDFKKATLTLVKDETEFARFVYDTPGRGGHFKTYGKEGEQYAINAGLGLAEKVAADDKLAGVARNQQRRPITAGKLQGDAISTGSIFQDPLASVPKLANRSHDKNFAIVIGIEKYRSLPHSDYSGSDAIMMKEYLKASGFPERNIMLLTDSNAGLADIKKSVERWLPNRVTKDSTVVFYYSGHGAPEPATGNGYLVPYDGDPNYLEDTAYSLKHLYEVLGKLKSGKVVALLDSCFSGAGGRSVLAQGARPLVMTQSVPQVTSNLLILSATQGGQISSSDPDKRHGIFTYHLLSAMAEGKSDVAEIFQSLKPKVEDDARRLNVEQSPSMIPAPEKARGKVRLF